ncbi:MAG: monovalent cation/H(+) antiporter subunit G [Balneolaceae bacterium]
MSELQHIASILLIVTGMFFMLAGSIGLLRLKDFYSRTHAVSKSDTLGILLVITGLIIFEGFTINSFKLSFIVLFIALSNPIGSHALARAAFQRGVKPLLDEDPETVREK